MKRCWKPASAAPMSRSTTPARASDPVPKHDAFNRGFNRLTPQTLKAVNDLVVQAAVALGLEDGAKLRSEEHTSELQSRQYLVCRLLLEKKKNTTQLLFTLPTKRYTRRARPDTR